jgi:hypothetical protein
MDLRVGALGRCLLAFAVTALPGCGGGGGNPVPPPPPDPVTTTTTTLVSGPPPIPCSTPPLNPLPNPTPSTPYIDSAPTGLCLRNGQSAQVEFTNRSNNEALVFSDYRIADKEVSSAQFDITSNACNQLNGQTLIPAAACRIEVRARCASAPSRAKLRILSNAQNAPSYDVQLTCNL